MEKPEYPLLERAGKLGGSSKRLYGIIFRKFNEGVPAEMIGKRMREELGDLIEEREGRCYANMMVVAETYERNLRNKIRKHPENAKEIIYDAMDRVESFPKEGKPISEMIVYGILRAIEEPVIIDGEEYKLLMFADDERQDMAVCTEKVSESAS